MKILPIHTEALRYFGYTEEEARFLYLVATHSGYFTCQQFLQFIKTKPGKRSVYFARKVVEKKHASSKEYLRHGRVFHLFSRNLYEAIGRENVRFRRVHSTEYIRTRLIALDFILRNQGFTYLESEEQKLSFFCNQLGIDKKILPHKRYSGAIKGDFTDRYFVDKFPMFYNPAVSLSPVMTFSFIDPGFESMDSFKTHLDAYLTSFHEAFAAPLLLRGNPRHEFRARQEAVSRDVSEALESGSPSWIVRLFPYAANVGREELRQIERQRHPRS